MEIKKDLDLVCQDFYYDLTDGGYLIPEEMCENGEDAKKVIGAIAILEDFRKSCEEQIKGFI